MSAVRTVLKMNLTGAPECDGMGERVKRIPPLPRAVRGRSSTPMSSAAMP